jgi:peptide-methionine (S)-S-oxide reductase|tara:strand:- start:60 stop:695 length:636 start_codon:yes stop_codon:yes gene_type:complete
MRVFIPLVLTSIILFSSPMSAFAAVQDAVLAGGCFWCLEHDLEDVPGVISAESGYSGGHVERPTYQQVSGEKSGHQEVVRVRFDPEKISYATLLQHYWRNIDPLDGEGQFCDRGDSYRPVIFTDGEQQSATARSSAEAAASELGVSGSRIKVQIRDAVRFWPAEDYHQNYAKNNDLRYRYYRFSCGRDRRLDAVWGQRARTGSDWASPVKQ